jgi:hypothetical protein
MSCVAWGRWPWYGHVHSTCRQWHVDIGQKGGLPGQPYNSGMGAQVVGTAAACSMELSGWWEWGWKDTILMVQEAHIGW